jgi:hypothetical protein
MNGALTLLRTIKNEGGVAVLTGLIAFGICLALVRGSFMAAVAFGVTAGTAAALLDTLFFHLLFLLRQAPIHAAEKSYLRTLEEARRRLLDGSIRLKEALIRRFEADYRRSSHTSHLDGRTRRQVREARRRLKARLWTVERVIPGSELAGATSTAASDPHLLENWTGYVDALVDARMQVQRRSTALDAIRNFFQPSRLARQTLEEWEVFARGH